MRTWSSFVLVGLVACTVEASRTNRQPKTDTVEQAAWYDAHQMGTPTSPEVPILYHVPKHTTCAEMAMGDASGKVDTTDRTGMNNQCHDLMIRVALDEGHEAVADFRDDTGQCHSFGWTSTRPIAGLLVTGQTNGEPTTMAVRYRVTTKNGGGHAVPPPVDGYGIIEGIEFCYEASDATPDGGTPSADAGTTSDGGTTSDDGGGGGKTW